ncbi:transporter substrate-binding domain-containing protein [Bdellovibrio bacteriovorus]|uniref:transporter substrate-binding domain-containing protein n=1 Tax=Bdellovibrio bacteriovorus TaxID=959 RepID=UPI000B173BDA|nr:transporter substrate-binding domain-containing protein [Bdellovibrio bacteriovorus]
MRYVRSIFLCFVGLVCSVVSKAESISLVATTGYKDVEAYKEAVEFVADSIQSVGITVKLIELPRKRNAAEVNNGTFDALPIRGLEDAQEFPNVITSSIPVAFTNFRMMWLKDKTVNGSEIHKYSGAIVLNNATLQARVKKVGLKVTEVNVGYAELLKLLNSKRVDYVIMPEEIIESLKAASPKLAEGVQVSESIFVRTPLYFTMHKKHKDLMVKIEEGLRKSLKGDLSKYPFIRHSLNVKLEKE